MKTWMSSRLRDKRHKQKLIINHNLQKEQHIWSKQESKSLPYVNDILMQQNWCAQKTHTCYNYNTHNPSNIKSCRVAWSTLVVYWNNTSIDLEVPPLMLRFVRTFVRLSVGVCITPPNPELQSSSSFFHSLNRSLGIRTVGYQCLYSDPGLVCNNNL